MEENPTKNNNFTRLQEKIIKTENNIHENYVTKVRHKPKINWIDYFPERRRSRRLSNLPPIDEIKVEIKNEDMSESFDNISYSILKKNETILSNTNFNYTKSGDYVDYIIKLEPTNNIDKFRDDDVGIYEDILDESNLKSCKQNVLIEIKSKDNPNSSNAFENTINIPETQFNVEVTSFKSTINLNPDNKHGHPKIIGSLSANTFDKDTYFEKTKTQETPKSYSINTEKEEISSVPKTYSEIIKINQIPSLPEICSEVLKTGDGSYFSKKFSRFTEKELISVLPEKKSVCTDEKQCPSLPETNSEIIDTENMSSLPETTKPENIIFLPEKNQISNDTNKIQTISEIYSKVIDKEKILSQSEKNSRNTKTKEKKSLLEIYSENIDIKNMPSEAIEISDTEEVPTISKIYSGIIKTNENPFPREQQSEIIDTENMPSPPEAIEIFDTEEVPTISKIYSGIIKTHENPFPCEQKSEIIDIENMPSPPEAIEIFDTEEVPTISKIYSGLIKTHENPFPREQKSEIIDIENMPSPPEAIEIFDTEEVPTISKIYSGLIKTHENPFPREQKSEIIDIENMPSPPEAIEIFDTEEVPTISKIYSGIIKTHENPFPREQKSEIIDIENMPSPPEAISDTEVVPTISKIYSGIIKTHENPFPREQKSEIIDIENMQSPPEAIEISDTEVVPTISKIYSGIIKTHENPFPREQKSEIIDIENMPSPPEAISDTEVVPTISKIYSGIIKTLENTFPREQKSEIIDIENMQSPPEAIEISDTEVVPTISKIYSGIIKTHENPFPREQKSEIIDIENMPSSPEAISDTEVVPTISKIYSGIIKTHENPFPREQKSEIIDIENMPSPLETIESFDTEKVPNISKIYSGIINTNKNRFLSDNKSEIIDLENMPSPPGEIEISDTEEFPLLSEYLKIPVTKKIPFQQNTYSKISRMQKPSPKITVMDGLHNSTEMNGIVVRKIHSFIAAKKRPILPKMISKNIDKKRNEYFKMTVNEKILYRRKLTFMSAVGLVTKEKFEEMMKINPIVEPVISKKDSSYSKICSKINEDYMKRVNYQTSSDKVRRSYFLEYSNNNDNKGHIAMPIFNPKETSETSFHPRRTCMHKCGKCHGKFTSLDTPYHLAQIHNIHKQKACLEDAAPLIGPDSCLCVTCFQTIEKQSCRLYLPKVSCIIKKCKRTAVDIFQSSFIDKIKSSCNKKGMTFRTRPNEIESMPFCDIHYNRVLQILYYNLCEYRTEEMFDINEVKVETFQSSLENEKILYRKKLNFMSAVGLVTKEKFEEMMKKINPIVEPVISKKNSSYSKIHSKINDDYMKRRDNYQTSSDKVRRSYFLESSNNNDNEGHIAVPIFIPKETFHPFRTCMDKCGKCHQKFTSLDTPYHLSQIHNVYKQKACLEDAAPLIGPDSCLCVTCFQTIEKQSCKIYLPKDSCIIKGCNLTAVDIFYSPFVDKVKSLCNKKGISFRTWANKIESMPFCDLHYNRVLQMLYFRLCGNRTEEMFDLNEVKETFQSSLKNEKILYRRKLTFMSAVGLVTKEKFEEMMKKINPIVEPVISKKNSSFSKIHIINEDYMKRVQYQTSSVSEKVRRSYFLEYFNNNDNEGHIAMPIFNPKETSETSFHPRRTCMHKCGKCHGKFTSLDTPYHLAQIHNIDKQKACLEDAAPLIGLDSCLCVNCFQTIEKQSCRICLLKDSCIIKGCNRTAVDIFQSPFMDKIKSLCNKKGITFRTWPKEIESMPFCDLHYNMVLHILYCHLCGSRTEEMFDINEVEVETFQSSLNFDQLSVILNHELFICKACRIYLSWRCRNMSPIIKQKFLKLRYTVLKRICNYKKIVLPSFVPDFNSETMELQMNTGVEKKKHSVTSTSKPVENYDNRFVMVSSLRTIDNDKVYSLNHYAKKCSQSLQTKINAITKSAANKSTTVIAENQQLNQQLVDLPIIKNNISYNQIIPPHVLELFSHTPVIAKSNSLQTPSMQTGLNTVNTLPVPPAVVPFERPKANLPFSTENLTLKARVSGKVLKHFRSLQKYYPFEISQTQKLLVIEKFRQLGDLVFSDDLKRKKANELIAKQRKANTQEGFRHGFSQSKLQSKSLTEGNIV